jgi:hypothetical protein
LIKSFTRSTSALSDKEMRRQNSRDDVKRICLKMYVNLDFPRINILAMAKSLTEPELKQYNTNGLLDTKS